MNTYIGRKEDFPSGHIMEASYNVGVGGGDTNSFEKGLSLELRK
jgi:hypothetical protein